MTQWIHGRLSKVLGFEVPQEMVGYVLKFLLSLLHVLIDFKHLSGNNLFIYDISY